MKKSLVLIAAVGLLFSLGSCKPKQSAYRQVYEHAKQREVAAVNNDASSTESSSSDIIVSKPAEAAVSVRRERVTPVNGEEGARLKRYSVVIGSFQNHTNASSLKERMENEGYHPVLATNETGMIRVIAASFESREEAQRSREEIKERFAPQFQDAWLLEQDR